MSLLGEIAALAVLVIVLGAMIGGLPGARRSSRRRMPAPRRNDVRTLGRIDVARTTAADVHRSVRPLLREIAAVRLARHRIALDRDPERARAALGDELWQIVAPGAPAPADPRGPGLSVAQLRAFTDTLEEL